MDFDALKEAIFRGAVAGMQLAANDIAAKARRYAPVRNIFAGDQFKYNVRYKTASEIETDRMARARVGLGPERHGEAKTVLGRRRGPYRERTYRPNPYWRLRQLSIAGADVEDYPEAFTKRGRYEVRQALIGEYTTGKGGRVRRTARSSRWGKAFVGGNLKKSIHVEPADIGAMEAEQWVVAGGDLAPYAKYQEFGTRHNAAHPFLRPAVEETQGEIAKVIAEAISRASGGSAVTTEIEVSVRI